MGEQLVWKQTKFLITQVPLSEAIAEVTKELQWPPGRVVKELMVEKNTVQTGGAKFHLWRDRLGEDSGTF